MVANASCTTQRLFLYGRLDKAERPGVGGICGLSNAQAWVYIHAVDDIRAALLDHLNEPNPTPRFPFRDRVYLRTLRYRRAIERCCLPTSSASRMRESTASTSAS